MNARSEALHVRRVTARVFRCPLETPVTTSFGIMRDRPALLVEIEDGDGVRGWGEVWCNFPGVGAEHRARLIDSVLAPLLLDTPVATPRDGFERMTQRTHVLALQSAEPGPFAQAIAGLDVALWDLAARRAGVPLYALLDPAADPEIPVYASGLNPDKPETLAAAKQAEGYTAFKLKVGFGEARDLANLAALREALGGAAELMADANQGWDIETALAVAPKMERFALKWLEEPLRADRPWTEWTRLRTATGIPLAAGENVAGVGGFDAALAADVLGVVQPDLAKWGGFSGTLPVAQRIRAAGARYCPHYLGGGIGLLASAHLLAAVGGDGLLEIDSNPNPLRTEICGPLTMIVGGRTTLPTEPGLGIEPDLAALSGFARPH